MEKLLLLQGMRIPIEDFKSIFKEPQYTFSPECLQALNQFYNVTNPVFISIGIKSSDEQMEKICREKESEIKHVQTILNDLESEIKKDEINTNGPIHISIGTKGLEQLEKICREKEANIRHVQTMLNDLESERTQDEINVNEANTLIVEI